MSWLVKKCGKAWKAGKVRVAKNGNGHPIARIDRPCYGSTPEKALRAAMTVRKARASR